MLLLYLVLNANNAPAVSNYMLSGDIMAREIVGPASIEENGSVDNYNFAGQQLQRVPDADNILEENFAVPSNGSLQITRNPAQEQFSPPVEEPAGEPQKHTYASIVCTKSFTAPAYFK